MDRQEDSDQEAEKLYGADGVGKGESFIFYFYFSLGWGGRVLNTRVAPNPRPQEWGAAEGM